MMFQTKVFRLSIAALLILVFLSGCNHSVTPYLLAEWKIGNLKDMVWSPDSETFVVNYWIDNNEANNFVQAFSLKTLNSIWIAENSLAWDVVFTPDGKFIVESNTNIPTFYWRSIEDGRIIRKDERSENNKGCNGGGQVLIVNSQENTALLVNYGDLLGPSWNTHNIVVLRKYDFETGKCTDLFNYQGTFDLIELNSNGTLMAYGGEGKDDSVVIFDMEKQIELCRIPQVEFGRFVPNENTLAVVREERMVFINAQTCKEIKELNVSPKSDYENYFAFNPNGKQFAIARDSIEIRDTGTGEIIAQIPFPDKAVPNSSKLFLSGIKFSPDGKYLLISYFPLDSVYSGQIQLWQLK
ncbi:MAG TPA: WD40 repeat domain-containing protein [Anaerolineales bacterium]|nr:WD40 repeat domain-containing protein [Anaerolineales bacterium]